MFGPVIKNTLLFVVKLAYGLLFGSLLWLLIVRPYTYYLDFELGHLWPQYLFSSIIALIFITYRKARSVMVLFLPSLIGSAGQNYIILLLLTSLFTNPISNIGLNAIESTRVIGCSLTMTFDQLKERGKLILNPLIELFTKEKEQQTDYLRGNLIALQEAINDIGSRLGTSHKSQDRDQQSSTVTSTAEQTRSKEPSATTPTLTKTTTTPVTNSSKETSPTRNKDETDKDAKILMLDEENLRLTASIDPLQLGRISNATGLRLSDSSFKQSKNFTSLMYDSCMEIFRSARSGCDEVTKNLTDKCEEDFGSVIGMISCSPLFGSADLACPSLINQLVDEKTICQRMRNNSLWKTDQVVQWRGLSGNSSSIEQEPSLQSLPPMLSANLTRNFEKVPLSSLVHDKQQADIDELFSELNKRIYKLNLDVGKKVDNDSAASSPSGPKRLELSLGLNSKSAQVFLKTKQMVNYIRDKYKLRQYLLDFIFLMYDLYTTYSFLIIIDNARRYLDAYLTNVRFDNHYITNLFVRMDGSMKSGRVLPLAPDEEEKYITTFTCKRRTNEEQKYQRTSCTITVVFLAFTLSLMYLDNIFFTILDSIHKHSLIKYHESGHHSLNIKVYGQGSLARLMRQLTHKLNSIYELNRITTTGVCLPEPRKTSNRFYENFFGLILLYLLIDQFSIYSMRFRRLTCAYFYPEKERQRIEYLRKWILFERGPRLLPIDSRSSAESSKGSRIAFPNSSFSKDVSSNETSDCERQTLSLLGDENGELVYTIRDAIGYLANCITTSYTRFMNCDCFSNCCFLCQRS